MPTEREREYYAMGFRDGIKAGLKGPYMGGAEVMEISGLQKRTRKPKRKLSAWNKFVKANSRKKEFRYRDGKLRRI
jgi:hypothetical protein